MRPIRKRRRRPIGQPTLNFKRVLMTPFRPRTQSVRRNRHHPNMTATPNKRPAQSRAETSLLVNSATIFPVALEFAFAFLPRQIAPTAGSQRAQNMFVRAPGEKFRSPFGSRPGVGRHNFCDRKVSARQTNGYRRHYDSPWSAVARPGGITDAPDHVGGAAFAFRTFRHRRTSYLSGSEVQPGFQSVRS